MTTNTITIANVPADQSVAKASATKIANILTGTYLNLRDVGACPVGGSFDIIVSGDGTEDDVRDMALHLLANAVIAN